MPIILCIWDLKTIPPLEQRAQGGTTCAYYGEIIMEDYVEKQELIMVKPCPFCGGYAHLDKAYSYFRDIVIYCEGCDAVFTLDDCNATAEDIVNAWNRRSENEG